MSEPVERHGHYERTAGKAQSVLRALDFPRFRGSKCPRKRGKSKRFDFLGYTFRPRSALDRSGGLFVSFCPAISGDAAKAIRRTIRRWRLHLQGSLRLADLARKVNPIVRGWINYYGRIYPTELLRFLDRINQYLMRWAMRKHKRLRRHPKVAWQLVASVRKRQPELFAHWQAGATPKTG